MVGQLSNTSYIFLLKTEFSPKVKKKKKRISINFLIYSRLSHKYGQNPLPCTRLFIY